jgi:hypothetical protein
MWRREERREKGASLSYKQQAEYGTIGICGSK